MLPFVFSTSTTFPLDSESLLEGQCKQKNSNPLQQQSSIRPIPESTSEQKMIDLLAFAFLSHLQSANITKLPIELAITVCNIFYCLIEYLQYINLKSMSNLMTQLALLVTLLAAANTLTIGSLACCPATFVYDQTTLTCVCPSTLPFLTNIGTCVACVSPATWNNQTKNCDKCRTDQTLDASGTCVCPKTTPYNNGTACAPCPYELPIWNGHKCVACPPNTNYDIKSSTCTVCPEGLVYSTVDRTCEIHI